MNKLRKIKKIFLFLVVAINAFGFRIGNLDYNRSLEDGYREFVIFNDGTETVRYRPRVDPAPDDVDVTGAIELYPRVITIPPQSSKVLKMFGKSKTPLESREYKFYLNFDSIMIPTLAKNSDGKTVNGESSMSLTPSLQLKGYGGKIDWQSALALENIELSKDNTGSVVMEADVVNNGHAEVALGIEFYNYDESSSTSAGIGNVKANSKKRVRVSLGSFRDKNIVKFIKFYNDDYVIIKSDKVDFSNIPYKK